MWLKLPYNILDAFVYAHYKDGGLGIRSLRFTVPHLKVKRMTGMCQSEDPLTRYLATQPEIQHQISNWTRPAAIDRHSMDTEEQQRAAHWAIMVKTADCYGLVNAQHVPYANHWVKDGSLLMSGHRFCAAIALRCGALYSRQGRGYQSWPLLQPLWLPNWGISLTHHPSLRQNSWTRIPQAQSTGP